MRNQYSFLKAFYVLAFLLIGFSTIGMSQAIPEYIYYKFDGTGTEVVNYASSPVGSNPAIIGSTQLTQGGNGQFGGALQNITGVTSTGLLSTNWATNLPSTGFTISMWMNNMPFHSNNVCYLFQDFNANNFRCFIGGIAGDDSIMLIGGGLESSECIISNISGGPVVIHFVYDGTNFIGYRNGIEAVRVADNSISISGGSGFNIGNLPSGSSIDEFRVYNRALLPTEIANTWNQNVSDPTSVPLKPIAIFLVLLGLVGFISWKSLVFKHN